MNLYQFRYRLSDEQVLEYYRFIALRLPRFKSVMMWTKSSIPLLLLASIILFPSLRHFIMIACCILISLIWWFYLSSYVIQRRIKAQVDVRFLKKSGISGHDEVTCTIDEQSLQFQTKLNQLIIRYKDLLNVVPLQSVLLVISRDNAIGLIPFDVVGNDDHVRKLIQDLFDRMN